MVVVHRLWTTYTLGFDFRAHGLLKEIMSPIARFRYGCGVLECGLSSWAALYPSHMPLLLFLILVSWMTVAEFRAHCRASQGTCTSGDITSGDLSCEYKASKTPAWVSIGYREANSVTGKTGTAAPIPCCSPNLAKDAFFTPDFEGLASLYAKQGRFVLRVTTPQEATAVHTLKAVARKALPRS